MTCNDVQPLLDLLVDGELVAKDCALVIAHVETCSDCGAELAGLEDLHNRFQHAKESTAGSKELARKIGERLDAEQRTTRRRLMRRYVAVPAILAIAACFTLFVMPIHKSTDIDTLLSTTSIRPVQDKSLLAQKLDWTLQFINLPSWQLAACGIYQPSSNSKIARFDFVRSAQSGPQRLTCYQAPAGVISAPHAQSRIIAQKRVWLGSRGNLQFALWSQGGRDYLLVTPLPQSELEEIVGKA